MGCARKNGQTENTIVSIKGPKIELSFVIIVIFLTVTTVTVTGMALAMSIIFATNGLILGSFIYA